MSETAADHPARRRRGRRSRSCSRTRSSATGSGSSRPATARRRSTASPRRTPSTSSCSTSCCRSSTGSRSASGCARGAPCRSSCSPPATTSSTRCVGLELGADDYITKPFSIREFRSRVRALLRRAQLPPHQGADGDEVDRRRRRCGSTSPRRTVEVARRADAADVRRVRAPARRWRPHPGACSRAQALLEALWGGSDYREPRTIDVHVRHLREKLERDPREPEFDPHRARRRLPLSRTDEPAQRRRRAAQRSRSLVVVALALALVYLIVVPSLGSA